MIGDSELSSQITARTLMLAVEWAIIWGVAWLIAKVSETASEIAFWILGAIVTFEWIVGVRREFRLRVARQTRRS